MFNLKPGRGDYAVLSSEHTPPYCVYRIKRFTKNSLRDSSKTTIACCLTWEDAFSLVRSKMSWHSSAYRYESPNIWSDEHDKPYRQHDEFGKKVLSKFEEIVEHYVDRCNYMRKAEKEILKQLEKLPHYKNGCQCDPCEVMVIHLVLAGEFRCMVCGGLLDV